MTSRGPFRPKTFYDSMIQSKELDSINCAVQGVLGVKLMEDRSSWKYLPRKCRV